MWFAAVNVAINSFSIACCTTPTRQYKHTQPQRGLLLSLLITLIYTYMNIGNHLIQTNDMAKNGIVINSSSPPPQIHTNFNITACASVVRLVTCTHTHSDSEFSFQSPASAATAHRNPYVFCIRTELAEPAEPRRN